MTEQALRELYLKPFETAVIDGAEVALLSERLQIRNNYHSNSEMLFPFFIILIFINTLMMNKQCVKLVEA